MKKLGLWIFCLGFLGSFPAMGTPESESSLINRLTKPELTEDDRYKLFFQGQDNPRSLVQDLSNIWKRSAGDEHKLLRARIGWLMQLFGSDELIDDASVQVDAIVNEALRLAESEKLSESVNEIRFHKLLSEAEQSEGGFAANKSKLIQIAEHIEHPDSRANALSRFAFYLADRGMDNSELPALLSRVRHMIRFDVATLSPMDVDTLNTLSLILGKIGQFSEAKEIGSQLDEFCALNRMRYFCSVRAYGAGYSLIKEDLPDSGQQSIPYFLKSLDLAQEIHDQDNIASSYYGLNLAYNKLRDFAKAIPYGQKSADIYEKLGAQVQTAIALNNLAASYLGAHRLPEALATGQKALKLCPADYHVHRMKIYKQLSLIHEALNQYQEAFRYLGLYVESEKATSAADANKKYMELRNQSLSQQNKMQAEQIQLLTKFRYVSLLAGSLSLIVCIILLKVWRQASVIRLSRQKMKEVLDHIDEGIFVLNRDLRVISGYSPHLDKIFGREEQSLSDCPALDLLFPPNSKEAHQGILVKEALLACIGEEELSWEINSGHLPHEVAFQDMILALHWQPLLSSQKLITSYLVSVRDITALRTIEKKMQLEARRVQLLQSKLEEVLKGNSSLMRQLLQEMTDEWSALEQQIQQHDQRAKALRRLHTWKGAARTLGLKHLAGSIHEMESTLVPAHTASLVEIDSHWKELGTSLHDYEHLLNTLLVSQKSDDKAASDLYAFAPLYGKEMKDRLDAVGCLQQGVMVLDHVQTWKPKVLARIHEMLLHAVSNAVDHGFLRPIQENKQLPPALIQIKAFPSGTSVNLQVLDNGAGIQWSRLREKADALGFVPKEGQSYADLLFMDGVSTAASTTETSGRGVGLSAIRSICLELGGTITLDNAENGGTALKMAFPVAAILQ